MKNYDQKLKNLSLTQTLKRVRMIKEWILSISYFIYLCVLFIVTKLLQQSHSFLQTWWYRNGIFIHKPLNFCLYFLKSFSFSTTKTCNWQKRYFYSVALKTLSSACTFDSPCTLLLDWFYALYAAFWVWWKYNTDFFLLP